MCALDLAAKPFRDIYPVGSLSSMTVQLFLFGLAFWRPRRKGPAYLAAAASPFHLPLTWCHIRTRPQPIAQLMMPECAPVFFFSVVEGLVCA